MSDEKKSKFSPYAIRAGRVLYLLYPLIVLGIVLLIFPRLASAGQIRRVVLSQSKPGVINLAFGRATEVKFQTKPEKLVPGSPQKVDINFLGRSITISPLQPNPGNLLIFTTEGSYVLLFRIVPESSYDDKIEIVSAERQNVRPIRLGEESYHLVTEHVLARARNSRDDSKAFSVQAIAYPNRLLGDELLDFLASQRKLKCENCLFKKDRTDRALVCLGTVPPKIKCSSEAFKQIELTGGAG